MNTLITVSGSGIGEALSLACAKRGDTLFLCDRDEKQLERVAARCRDLGATVSARVVDMRDTNAMQECVLACDAEAPLERVFANTGISTVYESEESARKTFETNIGGCVNTVFPALDAFRTERGKRRRRQIAIMASTAGYTPQKDRSTKSATSATKDCIKTWGLSMREALAPEGIEVCVICPGFVRPHNTDGDTDTVPFLIDEPRAATKILKGVDKNVGIIALQSQMRLTDRILSALPHWLRRLLPK